MMSLQMQPFSSVRPLFKSPLLPHNAFLDPAGVIRSGSRLREGPGVSFEKACPIILDRRSDITRLIVENAHFNFQHPVSYGMLRSKIRSEFLIFGIGKLMRQIRSDCVVCKKARAPPAEQQMAPLPENRLGTRLKAFDCVGIDFAGPYEIRFGRGKIRKKSYILVMTCMAIRAVHLEATGGMETHHVINALSRFADVRGVPTKIISDNQTSFRKADKDLLDWYNSIDWELVARRTGFGFNYSQGIEWEFNPPRAPHFGGIYEIIVKSTKRALKTVLSRADFDQEEFSTCISKVAFMLNNRPIQAYVPMESDEQQILTPNHFLIGHQDNSVFPPDLPEENRTLGARLRYQDLMQKKVWKRFNKELLPLFGPRQKWRISQPDLKPGEIVIEIDENQPRGDWKMRRVVQVIESGDNKIRKVELVSPEGKLYLRPIARCIPIC